MQKKRVVIIGAGPAGITAGLELLRKSGDYEVLILEETDAVGGISRTVNCRGNHMDMGGHRFFSKDKRVTDWWESILPMQGMPAYDDKRLHRDCYVQTGGTDPEREERVMLWRRRISRILYNNCFFDYPVKLNMRTIQNMGFAATCAVGLSYIKAVLCRRPETSLENFYVNRFGKKLYTMFFEDYTEKVWGRHPKNISADWGAQRVKGLSVSAVLKDIFRRQVSGKTDGPVETSLIEAFYYPKYGPGQMWETAAALFEQQGGIIRKNSRVVGFGTQGQRVSEVAYLSMKGHRETVRADYVISSMALKDLLRGIKEVPQDVRRIGEGLCYRDFVTVGLLVKKIRLVNTTKIRTFHNRIPDCWIYVQDREVKLGRIQLFNNWSPYMVADVEGTVWMGLEYFCSEGDADWRRPEEEWMRFGVSELVKIGVLDAGEQVLDWHCEKVKKAYPAYFGTYAEIDRLTAYLDTFENLYCVGRNGQHRYNNMDHSMMTAFEAVDNILSGSKDKGNVWGVNTEKVYAE